MQRRGRPIDQAIRVLVTAARERSMQTHMYIRGRQATMLSYAALRGIPALERKNEAGPAPCLNHRKARNTSERPTNESLRLHVLLKHWYKLAVVNESRARARSATPTTLRAAFISAATSKDPLPEQVKIHTQRPKKRILSATMYLASNQALFG